MVKIGKNFGTIVFGNVNNQVNNYGTQQGNNEDEEMVDANDYVDFEEVKEKSSTQNKQEVVPLLTRKDKILNAVNIMYVNGKLTQKYEFAAVYRIIEEKKIYEKFQFSDFEKLMAESNLPDNLKPSSDNIRKIVFRKDEFPNWRITDKDAIFTEHMVDIGKTFLDLAEF